MEKRNDRVAPHPILSAYYPDEVRRRQRVDDMFDSSARHYDWITDAMSFGSGQWYRRRSLLRSGLASGMKILDVGAGTGIVSLLAQDIIGVDGLVVAIDPSNGMLSEAKNRGVKRAVQGLGEKLPFQDNEFHIVTMGYALRHVADLRVLFSEYARVLKPDGKILLLEITCPKNKLGLAALKLYMKNIIPTVTRIVRHSRDAQELMRYYWDTIEQCVPPQTILTAMEEAGIKKCERHIMLGIFSQYCGSRAD